MTKKFKFKENKVTYGLETAKKVGNLTKLSEKIGKFKSHLRFNLHCKHNDVIPHYARIRTNMSDPKARLIIHKAERALLNNEISRIVAKKSSLMSEFQTTKTELETVIDEAGFNNLLETLQDIENKEFEKTRDIQKDKFNRLTTNKTHTETNATNNYRPEPEDQPSEETTNNIDKWVKNVSSIELSDVQKSLLSRGANFAVTPERLPIEDYICATEDAAMRLSTKGEKAALRAEVVEMLSKEKQPIPNISKKERAAIKKLKRDKRIIVTPADKGRCIVIMDRKEYIDKMEEKLRDTTTYVQIEKDPTYEIQEERRGHLN